VNLANGIHPVQLREQGGADNELQPPDIWNSRVSRALSCLSTACAAPANSCIYGLGRIARAISHITGMGDCIPKSLLGASAIGIAVDCILVVTRSINNKIWNTADQRVLALGTIVPYLISTNMLDILKSNRNELQALHNLKFISKFYLTVNLATSVACIIYASQSSQNSNPDLVPATGNVIVSAVNLALASVIAAGGVLLVESHLEDPEEEADPLLEMEV